MGFVERQKEESLTDHLIRNADALGLDDAQRARLDEAWRLQHAVGGHWDRHAASVIALEVQQGLDAGVDAAAKARGEKVARFNDAGARRIKSRDGLAALFESGALTSSAYFAGHAYRLLFETAGTGAGLGSQLEERVRAPSGSTHGAVAAGLFRAYAGVRLTAFDRAIVRADKTGRALTAVRLIAGEGQTLSSLAPGGTVKQRWRGALILGLGVVAAGVADPRCLRIRD
jgi:hypothetical protein